MAKKRTNPRRQLATKADIAKAKQAATREAMVMSIAAPLMAAHDVYGFGPKRLGRLLDNMLQKYNDLDTGAYTTEEANAWLWDYAGIRLAEKE